MFVVRRLHHSRVAFPRPARHQRLRRVSSSIRSSRARGAPRTRLARRAASACRPAGKDRTLRGVTYEEAERYLFLAWGELPLEFDFGGGAADGAAEADPAALDAPDPEELPPADLDDDLGALLAPLRATRARACLRPTSPWKTPRPPPPPRRLCWLETRPRSSSPSHSAPLSTRQRLYIEELVAERAGAEPRLRAFCTNSNLRATCTQTNSML